MEFRVTCIKVTLNAEDHTVDLLYNLDHPVTSTLYDTRTNMSFEELEALGIMATRVAKAAREIQAVVGKMFSGIPFNNKK